MNELKVRRYIKGDEKEICDIVKKMFLQRI